MIPHVEEDIKETELSNTASGHKDSKYNHFGKVAEYVQFVS